MLSRTLPALLALTAAVLPSAGCACDPFACSDVLFFSGLTIESQGALPDGTYRLKVIADGQELVSDFTIAGNSMTCGDDGCSPRASTTAHTIHASNQLGQAGGSINVYYGDGGGPADVKLELYRGDTLLTEQAYHPDYQTSEPNGAECGKVTAAQGTLTLPQIDPLGLCTAAYYPDGLILGFVGHLEVGTYDAIVTADGVTLDTRITLDGNSQSCEAGCSATADAGDHSVLVTNSLRQDGGFLYVAYAEGGGPAEIGVRLERDGAVLAQQSYTPAYTTSEPNGPGCGQVTSATGALSIE